MEQLNGETIFWLLSMGMAIGLCSKMVLGKRGLGLFANVISGGAGSVLMGVMAIMLQLPGGLLFGLLGCITILFIANIFSVHPSQADRTNMYRK